MLVCLCHASISCGQDLQRAMSGKLMGQVFGLMLTRAERDVLLALCDHARDDGTRAHPGVHLLAYKTDLSTRQVERYLQSFRRRGIIKQVGGGGHGRAVEYVIDLSNAERKPPFIRRESGDTQMSSELTQTDDASCEIRRRSRSNQTTFSAHSADTQMSAQPSTEPSIENVNNNTKHIAEVNSKHSKEVILTYVKYRKKRGDNIRTIDGFTNYLYRTGNCDEDIDEYLLESESRKSIRQRLRERGRI